MAANVPDGTHVTAKDITPFLEDNAMPVCPKGGTYTINPLGTEPSCSIQGHEL
jgi:hypothetical protein